jgi:TolB-like protein/Flp pilus assembly protein TadD
LAALKARRREVLDPRVTKHQGRIFKVAGDSVLVEFASAVNAVQCAVDLQQGMAAANAGQPEDRHIVLRIGVNLGDVMVEGSDLYGESVNTAARLEAIADPGGILVSGTAHDHVRNKVTIEFDDLGPQALKNIAERVRAYRVSGTPRVTVAAVKAITDKLSIAVLPFINMSGDPEQEYFSDGITEDIITELSRFRSLFVIARNSSFTFKGKVAKVQDIAKELGVAYVLEGSVRKAGDRVRITAQLIEAAGATHVWAERYDRKLDDIFAIQDEISGKIVASVAPQFLNAEMRRAVGKRDADLDSWEMLMKARWHLAKYTREANATAQALLAEVVASTPAIAQAHSVLALTHVYALIWSWNDAGEALARAAAAAQRALALDSEDAVAHAVVGLTLAFARRYDEAIESLNRAIALNPNLADAHGYLGVVHALIGDYDACLKSIDRACRLSPYDSGKAMWFAGKGIGAFAAGRYDEVIANAGEILREHPSYATAYRQRAAALAALGQLEEARADIETLLRLVPGLTIAQVQIRVPVKTQEAMERWLNALRKAGLPE